jgi:branched-chain amino acid aminotransferase
MSARSRIYPEVEEALKAFIPSDNQDFGHSMLPVVASAQYCGDVWSELEISPYDSITLEPQSKILHYPQTVFEGQRAFITPSGRTYLFRPDDHHARFAASSARMAMPALPKMIYMTAVREVTRLYAHHVRSARGSSLYIRPFMIGTDTGLGIDPCRGYRFMVTAAPSGALYESPSIAVFVERQYSRAARGGTGNIKTGGNYAAAMISKIRAQKAGAHESLWLDDIMRENVEELSGMNFFAVIDSELHTPSLTGTILAGITRDSILKLSQLSGIKTHERTLGIAELYELIRAGRCTECFACGTAASILPIRAFVEEDGSSVHLPGAPFRLTGFLREKLTRYQQGEDPDLPYDWRELLDSSKPDL